MLRHLPPIDDARVLVGTGTADDAAVYQISPDLAVVQTVDFFTPVVDDPYLFGVIAAANSLSDIYAMGAQPAFALNIVGFPSTTLSLDILGEILRGGSDKAREAGIHILGGHSVDDPEPKYGLAVTGFIHPNRIVTNAGGQPGDQLVLTKPLGIGIITTGIKRQQVSEATTQRAVEVMATLNGDAAAAMAEIGVHAATDVTGYGLLGHLREMVTGARLSATIRLREVPVLPEAWDLAARGIVPGGTQRNLAAVSPSVVWEADLREIEQVVLADAQTSGGLLIAAAPEKTGALVDALQSRGTLAAAVVGALDTGVPGEIRVVR